MTYLIFVAAETERSARRDGIREKYDEKRRTKRKQKKEECTNVKRSKDLCEEKGKKGAHM